MLELMTVGVEGGLTMANITTALTDCFSLMAGVLEQLVSQPVLLCLFAVSFIGRVRFQENQTGRYLKASKEMPPAPCGRTAIFFGLFSSGGLSRLAVTVLLLSFLAIF